MFRLYYPDIDCVFDIENSFVNTLVIENHSLLRRFTGDIITQFNGNDGVSILSKNNVEIPINKYIEVINEYSPFSLNRKNLITGICSYLEKISFNEEHYEKTQRILSEIELWLDNMSIELPCSLSYEKLTAGNIIRASGMYIDNKTDSDIETIYDYMELIREVDHEKIFIFIGLRDYFDDKDTEMFLKCAMEHDYRMFMIESKERKKLIYEKRLIIDNDLCII